MDILASSKTGSDKFDLRSNSPTKVFDRLTARQLAQGLRKFFEVVRGWSYSGDEGAATAIDVDLSIINTSNIASYEAEFTKGLNTLIGFSNTLTASGTANAIVLSQRKISADVSPNSVDYSVVNPLPLKYQDDLEFTFTAIAANTGATTVEISGLSGLSGAIDLVDESGNALVGGELFNGKIVKIKTRTISSVKKAILLRNSNPIVLFKAIPSANQTIAASTPTKVVLGTEIYDNKNYFSSSRFTPLVAGYYIFSGKCYVSGVTSASVRALLYINGVQVDAGSFVVGPGSAQDATSVINSMFYMNGSTDYAELYVVQYSSDGSETLTSTTTSFSGYLLS